jgi:diguanylate cyclase (GGDEF)-like protein/PAS domain S-box-containing protein
LVRRVTWLLAAAGVLLASSLSLRGRGVAYEAWLAVLAVASLAGVLAGIRLSRPRERRPWVLAASGVTLLALAQGVVLAQALDHQLVSFPGADDILRLAAYPLFGACLLTFVRRRTPAHDWGAILDAAVVAIGVASVMWVLVLHSVTADAALSLGAKAVSVAYPVAGIVLFGLVVRLVLTTGLGVIANAMVGLAATLLLLGDGLYVYGRLEGWYESGSVLDVARAAAPMLWAVAALDPSMRRLTEPVERPESWPIRRRIVVLLCAVGTTTAMVVIETVRSDGGMSGVTVTAAVALLIAVSARLANVVLAFDRSVAREEVLQAGAAALVAVRARDDIRAVAADTALQLAGGQRQAYIEVELGARPKLSVKDAVVVGGGTVGGTIRGEIRKTGSLGRLGTAKTFIVPIVVRDTLQGVIRVTGIRPLPWHLHQGLDTLASQVALALESARRRADLLERRSEDRFRSLVQNSRDVIAVLEPSLAVRYVTPSVTSMLGHDPEELVGTALDALLDPSEPAVADEIREAIGGSVDLTRELRLLHADGRLRTVECVFGNLLDDPSVGGVVLTAHDVSERRLLEDKLTHQAFHDALTGLPNRALLADRIEHALKRQQRTSSDVALLFLDLDDFKTINDSLGHAAGDDLLVEIASRLSQNLRAADTAARLGGDEFALLLEEAKGANGATLVAQRVLEAIASPIMLGSNEVQARASIGIVFGQPDQPSGDLLRNADVAMYRAKQAGGHRFQLFEPEMHEAALTRLELKADLERAFVADELDLHYQPLVDLTTGRIVAFEALLRWKHPVRGFVPPIEFIPLAEETGLINDIGAWVMHRACRQIRFWQVNVPGQSGLAINVNLSARQILQARFGDDVTQALAESGLNPSQLVLEITESTLMEDVEGVSVQLAELRRMGIRLAIDDFGTGFSSLGYLQRFPVDELKIAREFVDEVVSDPRRARLVEAVVALARSLELVTVAEGIEEPEQRQRLLELGCAVGQGYLFSRPLPAAEVPALLAVEAAA